MFRIFLIFAFYLYVSYKFIQRFSRGEFDDAITILQRYKQADCPANYKLHRLQYNNSLYSIQSETWKYLSDEAPGSKVKFRRCLKLARIRKGDLLLHDNFSDFINITERENAVLEEACSKINHSNTEFHNPAIFDESETTVWSRFLSYWFEIVKGPVPNLPEPNSEADEGNIRTLLGGIFPGTLWCGFGNIADDIYNNLGELQDTDSCCRAHDLCKPKIRAFQTRYYHHNPSIIPVSHCSCDIDFYNCLKRVNSPASHKIGHIFYNLVQIKCFDFDMREVCIRGILGFCYKTGQRCVAVLKNSAKY